MMVSSVLVAPAAVLPAAQPQAGEGQSPLQMVAAQAELMNSLNAKKVKPGESVRARITGRVKLSDGRELPADTILEGHVDAVQASEKKSNSLIVVTFDQARRKKGEELPVKAILLSMWEPQEAVSGGMGSGAAVPGSQTSQSGAGAAIPSQMNVMSQGRQAVPGVKLHSDIHDRSSVTFTADHSNVNVPSGTEMRFGIVADPQGTKLRQ